MIATVPTQDLTSIVARFDEQIGQMAVPERNDRDRVREAAERAADWYARWARSATGKVLGQIEMDELMGLMQQEAPAIIARRNADQLAGELTIIEAAIPTSGLGVREERRLRSEIEFLHRDLLRDGHYHREHDDALVRMASVVRTAKGAWAESHLVMLERYLERGRWWLR